MKSSGLSLMVWMVRLWRHQSMILRIYSSWLTSLSSNHRHKETPKLFGAERFQAQSLKEDRDE